MSPRSRPRAPDEVRRAARSALASWWHTHSGPDAPHPARHPVDFLTKRVWPWIANYLKVAFSRRREFRAYSEPAAAMPGIVPIPDRCTIGLAADWGTGTPSAYKVATLMARENPDVTIHMGDVYYSGTQSEYQDYFLGMDDWPRGRLATYALNGNHEMYSGGAGYFDVTLPALRQPTSYFCLETAAWRVLGLDTGYFAGIFPLVEWLLRGRIRLHPTIREWLRAVVFAQADDRRPVVVLTHHNWFSAYDSEYHAMGADLRPYLDRVALWLWGHEHRFSGYAPFAPGGGPRVRARCIGHGGMPVEITDEPKRERDLVFADQRFARTIDRDKIGFCGYALLRLNGPELAIVYRDEENRRVLEERWTTGPQGTRGEIVAHDKDLTIMPGRSLEELVR